MRQLVVSFVGLRAGVIRALAGVVVKIGRAHV